MSSQSDAQISAANFDRDFSWHHSLENLWCLVLRLMSVVRFFCQLQVSMRHVLERIFPSSILSRASLVFCLSCYSLLHSFVDDLAIVARP